MGRRSGEVGGVVEAMSKNLAEMEFETLQVSIGVHAERVGTICIDRPEKRNALNETVRSELQEAIAAVESDKRIRALVITASDESSSFIAGGDVTELRERDGLEQREASKRPRVYEQIYDLPKPVIARVNGHALGGGCELIQACDVRIATRGSKLGQPEINLGLIPGGGGTQRLPRLVGMGHAMRLILSGEPIDADEAKEIGLIEDACESEELDDRVYGLAGTMAQKSPTTIEIAKSAVQASARMDVTAGIEYEAELFAFLFDRSDKNEGIDAFFENREPDFSHGEQ